MSFAWLKKVAQVGMQLAGPIATIAGGPAAGAAVARLMSNATNAIFTAEELLGEGTGAVKKETVIAQIKADLELTRSILEMGGQTLAYDEALLGKAVDSQVAAINQQAQAVRDMIAFKESIHPVAKPAEIKEAP